MLVTACASRPIHLGGDPGTTVLPAHELPAPEAADITLPGQPTYVGPGDRLVVDVYGMPDMSGREVVVDSEGQLSFSGAGRFEVYGKTAPEVADLLAARLRAGYVRDPQVTVSIKESAGRLVTIEGQVTKPGIYPVANHMSLLRTMAVSGGLTEFARIDDIVVFRTVKGQRYAALYNLRAIREGAYADPDIYANDVVVVGDSTSRRLFKDILQVAPLLMTPLVVAVDRLSK
jgi:polysaccharide export outer membrane protein